MSTLKFWYPLLRLILGFGVKKMFSVSRLFSESGRVENVCRSVPHENVSGAEDPLWLNVDQKEAEEKKGEDCVCCQYDEEAKAPDEIHVCCPVCNIQAHGTCFNRWLVQPVEYDAGALLDPPVAIPVQMVPRRTCPGCRNRSDLVEVKPKPPATQRFFNGLRGGFTNDKDIKSIREYLLGRGEEFRFHPWILFRDKIPRQLEKNQQGRYFARVVFKQGGVDYPYYFPLLHRGDVVLLTFGPVVVVRPSANPEQWPLNWSSEQYVQYAGEAAVRFYHGATNFNAEHVKNKMMEIISRDMPLWECVEHDCLAWITSPMARDAENRMADYHINNKKHAERLLYAKKLMSSRFNKDEIGILLMYFDNHDTLTFVLQLGIIVLVQLAILNIHFYVQGNFPFGLFSVFSVLCLLVYRLNSLLCHFSFDDLPRVKMANVIRVMKSCSHGVKLPELHVDAKLRVPREYDIPCADTKTIEVYGTVIAGMPFVVPKCCVHDIVNGLRIRFLFDRPWYTGVLDKEFLRFAKKFLLEQRWATWVGYSHLDWWFHLAGGRRATMLREDDHNPFSNRNWIANIFVKCEAYVGKTWRSFKPRIIQCRASSLQIVIGSFFYSVYKFVARSFSSVSGKNVYATTCNALELGFIVSNMQGDKYEADASNWDGSVTKLFLEVEKFFIATILPYQPIWMGKLMESWLNTCGSSQGVKYSCEWGRRSGDMWTSTFNTLLNILVTNFVWGDDLIQAVFNGDDNFFCVKTGADSAAALVKYEALGLKMVLVRRQSWETLEFCSGMFYPTARGVKWGLKPFRQLAKFGVNFKRHSKKKFPGLLLGSCLSMLPIAGHVPIFGNVLRRIVLTSRAAPVSEGREEWQINDNVVDDIDPSAILLFKSRYGLSDLEYDKLERWSLSVKATDFPMVLEDELFTRCARVDMASELLDEEHPSLGKWYALESPKFSIEQASPFLEEIACWFCPWLWCVIGALETVLGSFWALPTHFFLSIVRASFGPFSGMIVHLVFNAFISRANLLSYLQFDRCVSRDPDWMKLLYSQLGTGAQRVPGFFNLMSDCVGTLKNRLTDCNETCKRHGVFLLHVLKTYTQKSSHKKQKPTAQRPRAPRMKGVTKGAKMGSEAVREYIAASVNPFQESARGAKFPDENVLPSVPLTAMDEYVLATDDNGRAALTVLPFIRNHYSTPKITGNSYDQPYSWNAGESTYYDSQSYTEFQQVFLDSRTVAAGVQLSVVSPPLTTQGRLFIGFTPLDFSGLVLGDQNRPTSISQMLYTYKFHEVSLPDLVNEAVIIPFPAIDIGCTRYRNTHFPTLQSTPSLNYNSIPDGSGYEEKQAVINNTAIETMCGWPSLCIMIEGGAEGTPTLLVEMVVHTENLVRTNGHIITSSPAATPNRRAMDWVAEYSAHADGWLRNNTGMGATGWIKKGIGAALR